MSEPEDQHDDPQEDPLEGPPEEGPAPTPFDHPLFLPVLLTGLMLWFGYDGWFNPEMAEHRTFNQVGFGFLLLGALYTGFKGYREWKEDQE